MLLTGKTALVTGASSGIGEATARALAAEGAQVGLTARKSDQLQGIAHEIERGNGSALALPADLREPEQIRGVIHDMTKAFGRFDILVNNAGVVQWAAIADADTSMWRDELEVNLHGAMIATRFALDVMFEQRSGHIVIVSSLSGRFPGPGLPAYTASKSGVNGFAYSILYDRNLREHGIRVTLIEPAETDTAMHAHEDRSSGDYLDAHDVADAILYAVSRPKHVGVSNISLIPYAKE